MSLRADPLSPVNLFVDRTDLCRALELPDRVNRILLAAPALLVDGTYGDFSYWSGASGPSHMGLRTTSCQDWSSFGSLDYGMTGRAALSGSADWFAVPGKGSSCDSAGQRLLCAEP